MTLAMFGFFATMPSFVAYVFAGRFNNKKILIAALTSSGATGEIPKIQDWIGQERPAFDSTDESEVKPRI